MNGEFGTFQQFEYASRFVDGDAKAEAENVKDEMEMNQCGTSTAETPAKCTKTLREWAMQAYAILHECLEDPGREPRQLTDEDWVRYEFPDQDTVQCAVDHLIAEKRIFIVNVEYQMPKRTRFSTRLGKKPNQLQEPDEMDSSTLSASNMKYPFSHIRHYLKVKDEN